MRAAGIACGLLAAALLPRAAHATYSIAAVNQATGEVGGAGTSCVGSLDVAVIYGSVPGVGVVHAQARLSAAGRDRAVQRLGEGRTPAEILAEIAARGFDRDFQSRQYGVVTLAGEAAGFTGSTNGTWAGHDDTGALAPYVFTVQGNLLTGPAVISQAKAGFEAGACDLAGRLMAALEAGRANGEGDARCTPRGVPADSAFIRVDPSAGGPSLMLSVVDTGNQDPVTLLRAQFDAWRATHPCPEPPDAGVEPDAGPQDAGPADAARADAEVEDAARPDASVVDARAPDAAAKDAALPDADRVRGTIGSGCQTVGGAELAPLLLVFGGALARRRR